MPVRSKSVARRSRPNRRARSSSWMGWLALAVLVMAAAIALYFQFRTPQIVNTLPDVVTPEQAAALISRGAVVIDIRSVGWYSTYRIPGSLNVPADQLEFNLKNIPRNVNLVIIDDLGDQAGAARDLLLRHGFTAVTAVYGGITEWIDQGFYVEGVFPY